MLLKPRLVWNQEEDKKKPAAKKKKEEGFWVPEGFPWLSFTFPKGVQPATGAWEEGQEGLQQSRNVGPFSRGCSFYACSTSYCEDQELLRHKLPSLRGDREEDREDQGKGRKERWCEGSWDADTWDCCELEAGDKMLLIPTKWTACHRPNQRLRRRRKRRRRRQDKNSSWLHTRSWIIQLSLKLSIQLLPKIAQLQGLGAHSCACELLTKVSGCRPGSFHCAGGKVQGHQKGGACEGQRCKLKRIRIT